jgi:ADP-ribose pyrophosphatase
MRQRAAIPYIVCMPKSSRSKSKGRVLSSRTVYRGPAFWVSADQVLEPTGIRVRRDIVHHTGSVVVLAVEENHAEPHILLERQYRHAAQDFLWELPAGRIDKGEQELAAAKRELLEETGFTARNWRRILRFYASPGFVAETMALFLARGLRPGTAQPEDDEIIETRFLPLSAARRLAMNGRIRDAKTICGVLWLAQSQRPPKPRR